MADFNVNLSQAQGAGARVVAPAAPPVEVSADSVTPWVALGANLVGVLSQNLKDKEKKDKENMKNAVIADFTQKQTSIANAIERGMPAPQARMLSRSNFSQYAANYPALVSDFKSTNDALFENTGLGIAKQQTDMFVEAQKQNVFAMVKAGYPITDTTSPETMASWTKTYQTTVRAQAEMDDLIKRSTFSNSQNAEQRAAVQFEGKIATAKLLTDVGSTHLASAQLFVQDSITKAKAGNQQGAIADVTNYFSNMQGTLAAAASLHPELAGSWNKMFADLQKSAMDGIEGKLPAEAVSNQLKMLKDRAQLAALNNDPQMQGLYAVSSLINGGIASTTLPTNIIALNTLTRLGGVPLSATNKVGPQLVGNKDIEKDVFTQVIGQVKILESGKAPDPESTKQQLSNFTNHALSQVQQSLNHGMSSSDLKESANFFASPEYAKIISYGTVNKEQASLAKQVFETVYNKDVVNGISAELGKNTKFLREKSAKNPYGNLSYGQLVDFEWGGSGITVTSPYDKFTTTQERQRRDDVIAETQTSARAINQLVHIGAHMEGHTDYKKYWEENKFRILPNNYPDPSVLKEGQVVEGFKYLGGNTQNRANWMREVKPDGK